MGECIISRIPIKDESVPIIAGYHAILVTLKSNEGSAITNHSINCKDGNNYYNYKTNEKGQCLFVTNSGSANIFVSNNINGIVYSDISNTWINVDAPVGSSDKLNIVHNLGQNKIITSNSNIYFLCTRTCDIVLEGGGGSGGLNSSTYNGGGGGGGSGYVNIYNNQILSSGCYNIVLGKGGSGVSSITNGYAGGTSYIANTNYSAVGGEGGKSKGTGGSGYKSGTSPDYYMDSGKNDYYYAGNGAAGYRGGLSRKGAYTIHYYSNGDVYSYGANDGRNGYGEGGGGAKQPGWYSGDGGSGFCIINFIS